MRDTIEPRPVLRFPRLTAWQDLSAAYLERKHIMMALEAGFSEEEVRYMLNLPEEPGPAA